MIGNAPISPYTGIPGWETPLEEETLTRYAREVPKNGLIIEIGGEWGRSAGAFARGANGDVKILTVDMFPGDLLDSHRANLAEAGLEGRTDQFIGDSHLMLHADNIDELSQGIDLLFIDGDHTYEGVLADIQVWTKYVNDGGVVIFHDVAQDTNPMPHPLHFEVTRAIGMWLRSADGGEYEAIETVDTLAVFRRKAQLTKVASVEVTANPVVDEKPKAEKPAATAKKPGRPAKAGK